MTLLILLMRLTIPEIASVSGHGIASIIATTTHRDTVKSIKTFGILLAANTM
jgi:hypothetical protein